MPRLFLYLITLTTTKWHVSLVKFWLKILIGTFYSFFLFWYRLPVVTARLVPVVRRQFQVRRVRTGAAAEDWVEEDSAVGLILEAATDHWTLLAQVEQLSASPFLLCCAILALRAAAAEVKRRPVGRRPSEISATVTTTILTIRFIRNRSVARLVGSPSCSNPIFTVATRSHLL